VDGGLASSLEFANIKLHPTLWSAHCLISQPQSIYDVHYQFLESGAEVLITSSYQATFQGFKKIGIDEEEATQLLKLSVSIAIQARQDFMKKYNISNIKKPLIAASIGSYEELI